MDNFLQGDRRPLPVRSPFACCCGELDITGLTEPFLWKQAHYFSFVGNLLIHGLGFHILKIQNKQTKKTGKKENPTYAIQNTNLFFPWSEQSPHNIKECKPPFGIQTVSLSKAPIKTKSLHVIFKLQHGLFIPVSFYEICEIRDFESTFFKSCVFVTVVKSRYPMMLFPRGRLHLAEMFQKQHFTGKQRAVISNNGFWHPSEAGKLCCVLLCIYTA